MKNNMKNIWKSRTAKKLIACFCSVAIVMLGFSFPITVAAETAQAKIAPDLLQKINKSGKAETFPVIVWVSDIQYDQEDVVKQANTVVSTAKASAPILNTSLSRTTETASLPSRDAPAKLNDTQALLEAKRKIVSDMYMESNAAIKKELLFVDRTIKSDQITWVSEYTPVIKMTLTKSQIVTLSKSNTVNNIYLDDYEPIYEFEEVTDSVAAREGRNYEFPYDVWQKAINVPYVKNLGYDGSGVKIGVVDSGVIRYNELTPIEQGAFDTLHHEERLIADPNAPAGFSDHAYMSIAVLAATDGIYPGIAPGATIYTSCGTDRAGGTFGAIEWQISQGCRIISLSLAWEPHLNTYDAASKWLDHIAIQHDVTIVKGAANAGGLGVLGGGMSYNSIVVGASDSNNTASRTDDMRKAESSYYTGTTLAMKPDIMAPGTNVVVAANHIYSDTSAATPQVAAIIALMYQMRPSLESNQAVTKAILLAGISPCGVLSGRSIPGATTTAMMVQSGAGLADAKAMRYVTQNNRFVGGTLHTGGTYRKTFSVSSSDTLTRVALTWLKNNRITGTHALDDSNVSDADCATLYLKVTSPSGEVYRSHCDHGNVQLISFIPSEAGTYTIDVSVHEASSDEPNIYFGLAWY